MGLQDGMKQQEIRRNKGKKTKKLRKKAENTRKTATILWLCLRAILNYKTGHFFRCLPFLGPPSEVTAIYIYIYAPVTSFGGLLWSSRMS